jgi:hypothetical protein
MLRSSTSFYQRGVHPSKTMLDYVSSNWSQTLENLHPFSGLLGAVGVLVAFVAFGATGSYGDEASAEARLAAASAQGDSAETHAPRLATYR